MVLQGTVGAAGPLLLQRGGGSQSMALGGPIPIPSVGQGQGWWWQEVTGAKPGAVGSRAGGGGAAFSCLWQGKEAWGQRGLSKGVGNGGVLGGGKRVFFSSGVRRSVGQGGSSARNNPNPLCCLPPSVCSWGN